MVTGDVVSFCHGEREQNRRGLDKKKNCHQVWMYVPLISHDLAQMSKFSWLVTAWW